MQGRVIRDRYELIEQLGHGGMGSVWRALDRNLSIEVAVKLIQSEGAESPEARARFQHEALAAARLRSTHIVLITDHGIDRDIPFIVMELLRGESLAKRLQNNGRLCFERTLAYFIQIGDALAFAHERKIVHRDLKPDNVFITSERNKEVVKVLDFGVAKRLDAQSLGSNVKTHTGTLLGTPYYMSPEQTRGIPGIDHRADIWSFGVMVYECVTGRRPFDAATLPDLLMAICRDPCLPPSQIALVPLGFDEWFARATAREREGRFGSMEEALNGLSALQGARLVGNATPDPPPNESTAPTHLVVPVASSATLRVRDPATPTVLREPEASPQYTSSSGNAVGTDVMFTAGAHSVVPSSVTAPGVGSTPPGRSAKSARIWIWPALGLCVVVTTYALWSNSPQGLAADGSPTGLVELQHAALPSARIEEQSLSITASGVAQPSPAELESEARIPDARPTSGIGEPTAAPVANAANKPSTAESVAAKASVASPNVAPVASAGAKLSVAVKPGTVSELSVAARTQVEPTQQVVAAKMRAESMQPPATVIRSVGANATRSRPASSKPSATSNSWGL